MSYELIHGDARRVSDLVAPASVDVICTSPPYFALRSYRDGGEHFEGQLGSEPTPGEFLDALIACTADWLTVLRPGGSIFVNLGDKYSGSDGTSGAPTVYNTRAAEVRKQPRKGVSYGGVPRKSLMGLPWRYANRAVDELGLILRAEIIWSKSNGLPESVTDRVRRSHEQIFHFTREERYFAALDEVREAQQDWRSGKDTPGKKWTLDVINGGVHGYATPERDYNPLGKVPGSVWEIPSEPLDVPDSLGVDHFAAFPSELPRRIILGWSPTGWCTACEQPRRAVVERGAPFDTTRVAHRNGNYVTARGDFGAVAHASGQEFNAWRAANPDRHLGYACACPDTSAPTRPSVVLDPFGGTGTTAAVAHLLGRHGVNVDLSNDYLRLAEWRCTSDERLRDRVLARSGLPKAPAIDGQLSLLGEGVA